MFGKTNLYRCFIVLLGLYFFSLNTGLIHAQTHTPTDTGHFQSFDKTSIYYESYGKGFPVILVHGFIVNSNSWKHTALMDSLLVNGFKVILVDLRGNGKSDKPHEDNAYEKDAEAKDLVALANFLKLKSFDVIGYSRGSIITTRLLLRSKNIHKAVIGGIGTDFLNPNWPRRILFYQALTYDTVPELHGLVKHTEQPGLDRKSLALLQKYQPSADSAQLRKIKTPIIVLKGKEDNYSETAENFSKLFPHSKFTTIPGDHDQAVATSAFAHECIEFLK